MEEVLVVWVSRVWGLSKWVGILGELIISLSLLLLLLLLFPFD